jgi:hypothetical protein
MTIREIASESVEFVQMAVQTGGEDPTAGTVSIGFSDTDTAPTTWTLGEWEGVATVKVGDGYTAAYIARFLIGPSALSLAEGTYHPWAKVVANGQSIIRQTDDQIIVF